MPSVLLKAGGDAHHIVTRSKDVTVQETTLALSVRLPAEVSFTWPAYYIITLTLHTYNTHTEVKS